MVAADGAVVDYNVPGPERDGVPLGGSFMSVVGTVHQKGWSMVNTFFTSKRFFSSPSAPPPTATFLVGLGAASVISTSAMVVCVFESLG